jgi:hypothetical protein
MINTHMLFETPPPRLITYFIIYTVFSFFASAFFGNLSDAHLSFFASLICVYLVLTRTFVCTYADSQSAVITAKKRKLLLVQAAIEEEKK